MARNEQLDLILDCVRNGQSGMALHLMENFFYTFAFPKEQEQFLRIKEDYRLMVDYWQRGFEDPQRETVHQQLLQRLFALVQGMVVSYSIRNSSFVLNVYKRARAVRRDWSLTSLKRDLESFVSEQALLELQPEHTRGEAQRQLYETHQEMLRDLFDYIWTSRTWSEHLGDAFIDILLAPTVDSISQRLVVSAITLSLLNAFDFHKLQVLTEVYRQTNDLHVRQRALVGWALGLDSRELTVYPELETMLRQLLSDDDCRRELKELQMQLVYCLKADEDSQRIQEEMIPELIKNNGQFKVTRNGIEEIEEDALEDILHPEASEQRMEQLEATMRKMIDMQRAGSDIYFGGFAKMKRFPFFNDVCNWLMPFYQQHPALQQTLGDERRRRILMNLLMRCPFCDSDAYSFALGFIQTMDHMPANVLGMLDRGELSLVGEMQEEGMEESPYIRRKYLQDLYRFYRLFPSRSVFDNPFDTTNERPRLFFFAQPLLRHTPLVDDCVEVAAFLTKQKLYKAAALVLENCTEEQRDERYYMAYATVAQHTMPTLAANDVVADCYRQVLSRQPRHEKALRGLARALFVKRDYQGALDTYDQLLLSNPDHQNFLLNKAVCLSNLERYEEALKILYKMDYEEPDNMNVKRVLAWTLVGDGKLEQAGKVYTQILETSQPEGDDLLNYGLCQWLAGDIVGAVGLFKQYAVSCGDKGFDAEAEFRHEEAALLRRHGISDVEIRLMVDAINVI